MPSVFNIVRACVYSAILLFTVICLAIAGHFQSVLAASDLTRFVPLAIFVCSVSLLLMLALLGFSLWRDRNPISTRIELGCLALAGVLWTALGAFVASSDSVDADVECYSADNELVEVPGFTTETYQAQYRVLEAFSFFNMILIWAFLIFLLVLALRQHSMGRRNVWVTSVSAYPWFGPFGKQDGGLPRPVTSRSKSTSQAVSRSRSKSARPQLPQKSSSFSYVEKDVYFAERKPSYSERKPSYPERKPSYPERKPSYPERKPSYPERRPSEKKISTRVEERPAHPYGVQAPRRLNLDMDRYQPSRNEESTPVYEMRHTPPDRAHVRDKRTGDKYRRDASPRR